MEHSPSPADSTAFLEGNRRWLLASLAVQEARLKHRDPQIIYQKTQALAQVEAEMNTPPALLVLARLFGLSTFERDLLLLCAGIELDTAFASTCAAAGGDPKQPRPTFSLAMAVLPDAYWTALAASSPLRRFQMLELGPGETLTQRPLQINESVLHFILGVYEPDERLAPFLDFLEAPEHLPPSQQQQCDQIAKSWNCPENPPKPAVLEGEDRKAKLDIAKAACHALHLRLAQFSPHGFGNLSSCLLLSRLLERDAKLGGYAVFIDAQELDERSDTPSWEIIRRLLQALDVPCFLALEKLSRPLDRPALYLEIRRPPPLEQRELWHQRLYEYFPNQTPKARDSLANSLASRFHLGAASIRRICASSAEPKEKPAEEEWSANLWAKCRAESRPRMDELSIQAGRRASWEELVLPGPTLQQLKDLCAQVHYRPRVYEEWGLAQNISRGLGISALFSGPSGTGKTLSAEVVAAELRVDLYRVDISRVISKYIGETEKNLRRVFDAAAESACVLLFDEADALFARRTQVSSSHDRYSNLETAYLLQRMETHPGITILTTNQKEALDPAFTRRLRFIVDFPHPSEAERKNLWKKAYSATQLPMDAIRLESLGRLRLCGGSIRNIAVNAAFLAAGAGTEPTMEHILQAARAEYKKLGRPLPELLLEASEDAPHHHQEPPCQDL